VHLGDGITVCVTLMMFYRLMSTSRTTNTRRSMVSWSTVSYIYIYIYICITYIHIYIYIYMYIYIYIYIYIYRRGCFLKHDMSAGDNVNCYSLSGRLSRGILQGNMPRVFVWVQSRLTLLLSCTALSTTPHLLESANSFFFFGILVCPRTNLESAERSWGFLTSGCRSTFG